MENEEIIGSTGELVDLFKKELTQEEWNAIAIVNNLKNRLNLGIRFDWSKSIDVRSETTSQIIDESVFLERVTTDAYDKAVKYVQESYIDNDELPALLLGDVAELIKITTGKEANWLELAKYRK